MAQASLAIVAALVALVVSPRDARAQSESECPPICPRLGLAVSASDIAGLSANLAFAGLGGVQSQIRAIRDGLRPAPGLPPLPYTGQSESGRDPFWPISWMADAPAMPLQPAPAAPPPVRLSAWGQAFGDYERRDDTFLGFDISRTTRTAGVVGGVDLLKTGLFSPADAGLIGVLTGYTAGSATTRNGTATDLEGPSLGVYGVWVQGGLSLDAVFKADFLDVSQNVVFAPSSRFSLDNYTLAANISYRFDLGTWWVEPTAGLTRIWTDYQRGGGLALALSDGRQLRIQGGLRVGTAVQWGAVRIEPTLTALLYNDVEISGSTVTTVATPLVPTDEGRMFGQLIGKLNADFGRGLAAYLEGEVRGRPDVLGVAGRAGLRYTF